MVKVKAEVVTLFPRIMLKLSADNALEKCVLEELGARNVFIESYGGPACSDTAYDVRLVSRKPKEATEA